MLFIPQKYFEKWEVYTKFRYYSATTAVRLWFRIPDSEKYDGYSVAIDGRFDFDSSNNVDEKSIFSKNLQSDKYVFYIDKDEKMSLIKTRNRLDSKRYKRYTINCIDLQDIYNLAEEKRYVLASIIDYVNDHTRRAYKISKQFYAVGIIVGEWFFSSKCSSKRKIGSKGVEIIGELKPSVSQADIEQLISENEKEKDKLYSITSKRHQKIWRLESIIGYIKDFYDGTDEILKEVKIMRENAQNALEILKEKDKLDSQEYNSLDITLLNQLKELCLSPQGETV